MHPKKYIRLEPDGVHLPDADVGDSLYYGVDFKKYLEDVDEQVGASTVSTLQNEEIVSAEWALPTEIESDDDFIADDVAIIKLTTLIIGKFKVICTLTSIASGKTQVQVIPLILTVY